MTMTPQWAAISTAVLVLIQPKFDGVKISVLQFIRSPPDSPDGKLEQDREETRWINRMSSIVPRGLNLLD